jgi:hypothetical protein
MMMLTLYVYTYVFIADNELRDCGYNCEYSTH